MYYVIFAYLLLLNIIAMILMYSDKQRARTGRWRVPEKWLFLSAILGGSIGANLGMQLFRHKTKHWYFVVFMPIILFIQCAAFIYFYITFA